MTDTYTLNSKDKKSIEELVPGHMHDAIFNYIEHGLLPGSFLYAVLTNDLVEAVERADHDNYRRLEQWVRALYNHAPSDCWGSVEKVRVWSQARSPIQRSAP